MVQQVREAAAGAAVVMVVGGTDTGKTTLVTALANAATERWGAVGVLDADLGQSTIGLPTTVGLGRAQEPLARLAEAETIALEFVGVTSPAGNLLGTVVAVRRMLERARAEGLDRVLVDTSGFVAGDVGRVLKQAKIDVLDPDLVVCVERAGECEAIVAPYRGLRRPRVLRAPAPVAVRPRSAEERRRYRAERLHTHFTTARAVALDLDRVVVRLPGGEALATPAIIAGHAGILAGLEDQDRRGLGLAVLRGVDAARRLVHVETPVDGSRVAALRIGRERYGG